MQVRMVQSMSEVSDRVTQRAWYGVELATDTHTEASFYWKLYRSLCYELR
jgi:hypothetical protein